MFVPWPVSNTAPCPVGTVQRTEVALAGKPAIWYVYTLSGHGCVSCTSITPGVDGFSVEIFNVRAVVLVPQPFVAVTETVPLVKPGG